METATGRTFFGRSDKTDKIIEIREYRRDSERFVDIGSGRIRGPEIILRTYPDGDLVVRVEGDPKAYKVVETDEIIREP
jgi:hypothetical protein